MIDLKQAMSVGDRLGVNWNKVDKHEFKMGMNEELEHRDVTHGNLLKTGKITLSHLHERKDYYTRLKKAMR